MYLLEKTEVENMKMKTKHQNPERDWMKDHMCKGQALGTRAMLFS